MGYVTLLPRDSRVANRESGDPGMKLFAIVPSVPWQCVWSMAAQNTRPVVDSGSTRFFFVQEGSILQDQKTMKGLNR